MKFSFAVILLLAFFQTSFISFAKPSDKISSVDSLSINHIRLLFYEAIEDEDKLNELESFIQKEFSHNSKNYKPIILAYLGGIEALKGKHAFNPFSKLGHVVSSLDLLEKAVERDLHNLEIRFIRFSILHHLPAILGYGKEREDDIVEICNQLSRKDYVRYDSKLQKNVIDFMLESERLTDSQTLQLKKLAVALASNE
jgi:hypothetical protein